MARTQHVAASNGRGLLSTFILLFTIFSTFTAILLGLAVYNFDLVLEKFTNLPDVKTVFPFDDNEWTVVFAGRPAQNDTAIVPWKLKVSEADLEDLKDRLRKTRYGTPLKGQNFAYGFPGDELKKEALINQYDHFKTAIEGLNIHYVHVKPAKTDGDKRTVRVVPIILLHGWPGSFFELYKLIPLLTTPQLISGNDYAVFEVIIPSLPGYGFSDAAQKPGLNPRHMARIFSKLMSRLKFEKIYVHGGNWGSFVARSMAIMYPERILGLEMSIYRIPMSVAVVKSVLAWATPSWISPPLDERKLTFNTVFTVIRESGYLHIQATKPDTAGAALMSDPAGLAAYILEKFSTWTNAANIDKPDGGLAEYFTLDELLTNVMIYWTSGSIITSQRLYKETFSDSANFQDGFKVTVPTVLSDFKYDLGNMNPPNSFVKPFYPGLIKISSHAAGGHFPSLERPADVAGDIWSLAKAVLSRDP